MELSGKGGHFVGSVVLAPGQDNLRENHKDKTQFCRGSQAPTAHSFAPLGTFVPWLHCVSFIKTASQTHHSHTGNPAFASLQCSGFCVFTSLCTHRQSLIPECSHHLWAVTPPSLLGPGAPLPRSLCLRICLLQTLRIKAATQPTAFWPGLSPKCFLGSSLHASALHSFPRCRCIALCAPSSLFICL